MAAGREVQIEWISQILWKIKPFLKTWSEKRNDKYLILKEFQGSIEP